MSTAEAAAVAAPLRLVGPPPKLSGTLQVANDTEGSLWFEPREASLRSESGAEIHGALRISGRATPMTRTRVRVRLVVDAGTPPGLYKTEVDVGGVPQAVEARVLERLQVSVRPDALRLRAPAGENIHAELVVSNDGNVEHVIPQHAVIWFEDEVWVQRAVVDALRETGPDDGSQPFLDRVVRRMRTTMTATTTLTLKAPVAVLAPGAETVVSLSATLPRELAKGRTYIASFTFAGDEIRIEIDVTGAANSTKRRPA